MKFIAIYKHEIQARVIHTSTLEERCIVLPFQMYAVRICDRMCPVKLHSSN